MSEALIYNTLTLLIVVFAFFIAVKRLFHKFFPKSEKSCSSGCGSCSTPCELKNMVQNAGANAQNNHTRNG